MFCRKSDSVAKTTRRLMTIIQDRRASSFDACRFKIPDQPLLCSLIEGPSGEADN
jgi:hypothetical protein